MTLALGTDEAGYGPNLGPLVVAASAWRLPGEANLDDLPGRLAACVANAEHPPRSGAPRVWLADSKQVYAPQKGLAALERGVLGCLAASGPSVADWPGLWETLTGQPVCELDRQPWHIDFKPSLPFQVVPQDLAAASATLRSGLAAAGVGLLRLRARVLFPEEFNRRVAVLGNKAELLTEATLELVRELRDEFPRDAARIVCDKHGGRNRYLAALVHHFPDERFAVLQESRAASRYDFDGGRQRFEFRAGGEACLPIALASMTAKYLRELCMEAFNQFWRRHVPGLRPTAGYPQDAARFRAEIAAVQRRLGIEDHVLWRDR